MGGLRALCCSKQDKSDDSQDTPVRLAQPPPQKSTQNAPVGAKKRDSSTAVSPVKSVEEKPAPADLDEKKSVEDKLAPAELSEEKPAPRDLWKEAYDNLDPSRKPYVAANGVSATDAIDQVVEDTKDKYAEWKKGGLKIHQKNGDDIDIGDYAEKILGAALKASEVISFAVSFDPTGHASSAWTVISFGMNVSAFELSQTC